MRAIVAILCASILCGCRDDANNNGWGFHYDEQSAVTGLRLRYPASGRAPRVADIDKLWQQVQGCVVSYGPGPLVIVTDDPIYNSDGSETYGRGYLDTNTVFISSKLDPDVTKNWWWYKHEMVHIALDAIGEPVLANKQHLSPAFSNCVMPP